MGLKQGCNLSPLLFNIFINDIPNIIDNSNCEPPMLSGLPVSCLLYADDLVLLSRSRAGLQNSINALYGFSKDWFLEINQTKTKCMVFSKGRKLQLPDFMIGDRNLSFCEEYCYLGIMFTRSGSFKSASRALTEKAANAMFSIIRNIYRHRTIDTRIMLDLFDKMVVPIALYGVEVWGVNFVPTNENNTDFLNTLHLSKHSTENLQYRFFKILLGVSRRTSNWAVATELGRYPLIIRAFKHMCKYYSHLSKSSSPILKAALNHSKFLAGLGFNSWYNGINKILKFGAIESENIDSCNIGSIFNRLFLKKWKFEKEKFLLDGKLGVLASIKNNLSMSHYLTSNLYPMYKRALAKIRLSAHKLPIEIERYMKIPRNDRVCSLGCNVVGDEVHYLLECEHPAMKEVYTPFLNSINSQCHEIAYLDNKDKLVFLLNSTDDNVLFLTGKLCHKVLDRYNEISW